MGITMPTTPWLSPREERAWRGYLRMRDLLDLQIRRDLTADASLSDSDYSVLATVSENDEGYRLVELADRMLWSKSRVGHQLDRMAARGLVRRDPHPENSRAVVITLTDEGWRTLHNAAPRHLESVRRHFVDLLTEDQIDVFGDATATVIEHLQGNSARPH